MSRHEKRANAEGLTRNQPPTRSLVVAGADEETLQLLIGLHRPVGSDRVQVIQHPEALKVADLSESFYGLILGGKSLELGEIVDWGERWLRAAERCAFAVIVADNLAVDAEIRAYDSGFAHLFRKPLVAGLIEARLAALWRNHDQSLRRQRTGVGEHHRVFSSLTIDLSRRCIFCRGKVLPLTRTEYLVLELLSRTATCPVLRDSLEYALWEVDSDVSPGRLKFHIHRLRRKLRESGSGVTVAAVRGYGYLLQKEDGTPPQSISTFVQTGA